MNIHEAEASLPKYWLDTNGNLQNVRDLTNNHIININIMFRDRLVASSRWITPARAEMVKAVIKEGQRRDIIPMGVSG